MKGVFMKKYFVSTAIIFSLFLAAGQGFGLTFDEIKNNIEPINPDKKLQEIKNIPWEEKREIMAKSIGFFPADSRINEGILVLYLLPKNALNDTFSLQIYADYPESNNLQFFTERIKKPNFNIFFESNLLGTTPPEEDKKKEIYALYDKFNQRFSSGNFNYSDPNDKKLFDDIAWYIFSIGNCNYPKFEYAKNDSRMVSLIEKYLTVASDLKNQKINNPYHIFRLGNEVSNNYNNNSYDFISKKLNDKNTNLENLCYFLYYVDFDVPMTAEIEQEFDSGIYNPKDNILSSTIRLSQIIGSNNELIKYVKLKGIPFSGKERLLLAQIFFDDYTEPKKIIDKIAEDKYIPEDRKAYWIIFFTNKYEEYRKQKMMNDISENLFNYMINGIDSKKEQKLKESSDKSWEKKFNKSLKELHQK